jgi:hypothetical protein
MSEIQTIDDPSSVPKTAGVKTVLLTLMQPAGMQSTISASILKLI